MNSTAMSQSAATLRKLQTAYFTLKFFLACMSDHVSLQPVLCVENFEAIWALIGTDGCLQKRRKIQR